MEYVLDSLKNITSRWLRTQSPISTDISVGDHDVKVETARRFRRGDQIVIRDSSNKGEFHNISEIINCDTIRLESPANFSWSINNTTVVEKTWKHMFLQGIYLGEPDNIPRFPAITINANTEDSSWLTLGLTQEKYEVSFTIYTEDSWQESGYRWNIRMAQALQEGLKRNFYPLIGPYNVVALTQDALMGDKFIKVADTSDLWWPARANIEDPFHYNEIGIKKIHDSNTVELNAPLCDNYFLTQNPILIWTTRFIYNSWPSSISYGTVFKGTTLKASQITWFAEEAEIQCDKRGEPSLS